MASSCWCWFPLYFVASITLGVIAISSAVHFSSKNSPQEEAPPLTHSLPSNASDALRRSGFTLMADLLHRSPPFFLPPQNSTFLPSKTLPSETLPSLSGEQLAIHGVVGPFSSLRRQDLLGWDFIHSATCRPNTDNSTFDQSSKNVVIEWNRIVQLLGSKGYASFSIALHSVLDAIQKDSVSLSSATIFAPPDLKLLGSPSTLLDRAVRLHILPQRFTNKELSSLPVRTLLKTLVTDEQLEIDGVLDFMPGVVISGVEIVEPDMLSSEKFVVHGISRAFKMTELTA
ncbi:FAS1 domain superfamily [Sesbania bispinosa]|nr:FAS1 domain superfamily [Sesbania bispinosa]